MTDNLPAVRTEAPAPVLVRDTDSWSDQLPKIVELARSICGTDFVPEALRDNVAATAAAILYGREVQLPPMTALGNVNVIKGKPGLSAVIMRAQVLAAGHEIRQDESNNGLCTLSGRRRGTDYWQSVTYTIDDARQAGLLRQNPNYEKNPRRMLRARATSELCELMFADVVRGMPSLEELEEQDDDVQAGPPAKAARATVQRKARAPKTDDGAGSQAETAVAAGEAGSNPAGNTAPSSPPMPPLPGEDGYDEPSAAATAEPDAGAATAAQSADGEPRVPAAPASTPQPPLPGEEDMPAPVDEPRMVTRAQQRGMFAVFKELGIDDDQERMHITAAVVGRTPMHQGKPSSNGLTFDEANALTAALATCKTRDHVEALIELAEQDRAGV
jgi:hypothetical protein